MHMYGYDCSRLTIHLHNNIIIIGRSNTPAIVAGVVVPLLLLPLFTAIGLFVTIYMKVYRKRSAPLRSEQIESVNETFSVREPIESPDEGNNESDDGTVNKGEDADPPDEHALVPKPDKTPIQKTLLEELSAFA